MKVSRHSNYRIPAALREKLLAFRHRLWKLKLVEAVAAAWIAVLTGFLLTYSLDRVHDTSALVRAVVLIAAVSGCLAVPLAIHRWVIGRRRFDQLARLLSQTQPATGDQLLGVIELADERLDGAESEQSRSPQLVQAAIRQVADEVVDQDLSAAIPHPRHRQRLAAALALGVLVLGLLVFTAPAARNAFARFLTPWKSVPRYTFASIQPLPETLVVAQDEPFELSVQLRGTSRWQPKSATATIGRQPAHTTELTAQQYRFQLPGQLSQQSMTVQIGDFRGQTAIDPRPRPELKSLVADIQLPEYLGRTGTTEKEVRGSTLSVVKGSTTRLTATASRPLSAAAVNDLPRPINRDRFSTPGVTVAAPTAIKLDWLDIHQLTGKAPFELTIEPVDDAPPTVACEGLPRRKVLLDSEVLKFQVQANDDFGIKRVGLQWREIDSRSLVDNDADQLDQHKPAGEMIIGAGGVDAESLQLAATFSAQQLNIRAPLVGVRVFAEDYLPGRERAYSAESVFDVLSADQHSIWITGQLNRWQRMALDSRDRELQLHETNKQLRGLTEPELRLPQNQARLARQAELERAGTHQLNSLVSNGQQLLKEAMRNPEIGVGHLDRWAEMVRTLQEIADTRMPSVADLLQQAADQSASSQSAGRRHAGQNRLTQQTDNGSPAPQQESPAQPDVPTISDVESSHHDLSSPQLPTPAPSSPSQPSLTLPSTMLASPSQPGQPQPQSSAVQPSLDQAVQTQQDLLAEFDKIADELNEVLANLEGSTIVKRLKASSRRQQQVAAELAALVSESFGVSARKKEAQSDSFQQLASVESESSERTSHIMDDMDAYFQRSRLLAFRRVLDEMRQSDVTAELRLLSDELRNENGLSISQAEFWSDTFDRWAEDLVGVCDSGECPGGKAKGSLPPSVVLEVLQLLEGEVNLREQTRVVEQARSAVGFDEHLAEADRLWHAQDQLQQRAAVVIDQIRLLPDAEADFAEELGMLNQVSDIMKETVEILRKPDTGPNAIAAETEIIELLLKSKRFSPSGGGGAAAPGGGGKGDDETPALALAGAGVNVQEFREQMSATQSTGVSGAELPAEYRSGLDAYFNQLETWRSGTR